MTRRRTVLLAAIVAVIGAVLFVVVREGPDRTVTGSITDKQSHRVCVTARGATPVCVEVEAPQRLTGVALGDCVRLRYSAEGQLVSLVRAATAC